MKRYNVILVIIFIYLLVENVNCLKQEKIVGGNYAGINQFASHVSLQMVGGYHHCGGTLITPDSVLTAAHCVYDYKKRRFFGSQLIAIAGTTDYHYGDYKTHVIKVFSHKKYGEVPTGRLVYDVAVLKLADSFDVSGRLPIGLSSLPGANEEFFGTIGIVTGFGLNKVKNKFIKNGKIVVKGDSTGPLKYGYVKIVDPKRCQEHIYPTLLCGQMQQRPRGEGFCFGDSGGGLYNGDTVIGIVSTTIGCDETQFPGYYTKVSAVINFIMNAAGDVPVDAYVRTYT